MSWNIGQSLADLGDSFADMDEQGNFLPGIAQLSRDNEKFGNWYEGPGGESATKIGLALISMFGPGAAFLGGTGVGGEAAGGGSGTGGVFSQYGGNMVGNASKFLSALGLGGGGAPTTPNVPPPAPGEVGSDVASVTQAPIWNPITPNMMRMKPPPQPDKDQELIDQLKNMGAFTTATPAGVSGLGVPLGAPMPSIGQLLV